ncbi:MAG: hypothetical protein LBJ22_02440 [Synergistaceae bacterium]|jgi:hypothetical protein|nr:hypothetical protein [Synergistaceae bacterium]
MADIIRFDPIYLQELARSLDDASSSLDGAKASLQKASVGLDSGLVAFALCVALNEDIKKIKKTAGVRVNEAKGLSKVLANGAMRVDSWEETTKNRESGLASQLVKTWGFENGNFAPEAGQTTAGESSAAPSASGTGNSGAPDLNSWYYKQSPGALNAYRQNGDVAGKLDCVYYARARAMEVNGLGSYSSQGSGNELRTNSIARFQGHDVFIERLYTDSDGITKVVFSEGNWNDGTPDGGIKEYTLAAFQARGNVNEYVYF